MKDHTPKSALPTVLEAHHINDKNMLYFCCVTQCFSLSLITHKLKLNITDINVAFSQILRGGWFLLIFKKNLLAILPKEAFAESFPVCIGSCGCIFDRFRFFCSTLCLDL